MGVWPALRFNKLLLGFDGDAVRRRRETSIRICARSSTCSSAISRSTAHRAERPWTDDRAPVEWVTDRMIVAYAARGGELDEDYLPTRP